MQPPADLSEYLERCLGASSWPALREAALELPAVIAGGPAWVAASDPDGRVRVWGDTLSAAQRDAYATHATDDPLVRPVRTEPRVLSRAPGAAAFRRSELWARFHAPLGLRDELLLALSTDRPTAVLALGSTDRDFDDRDLTDAGLIQAVLAAAFARVIRHEPLETAHRVARQELRTRARTLVLLVDADGTLHGEGVERLSPDARAQVEALLAAGPPAGAAPLGGTSREIMLVRSPSEATGLVSLKVLPPDANGVSCVLVRLPADAGHLEEYGLSSRQAEVMALVLAGLDAAEISRRLGISPATVRKHTENAYRTLGVRSLTEFALRVF